MYRFRFVALVPVMAISLAGCTSTYSFAPPSVELSNSVSPDQRRCETTAGAGGALTGPSIDNAIQLAENFVVSYRCASRELANGRMDFEIPAFLSLVGGTTAVAIGAGSSTAIATGTTSSLYTAGKGYFDPEAKFAIVRSGQDAATCVLSVASGGEGFTIKQKLEQANMVQALGSLEKSNFLALSKVDQDPAQGAALDAAVATLASLQAMAANEETRFYNTVYASLLSIEMIIGEKIASAGQINMQDLMKRLDEIQNPGDPAAADTEVPDKSLASLGLDSSAAIAQLKTPIDFAKLEKNLQECVVKAHT